MNNKLMLYILIFLLSISCTVHKTVSNPEHKLDLRVENKELDKNFKVDSKWWKSFNDENLNEFVEQIFDKNLTIKQSIARLKQMEAIAQISKAGLYPSLNLSASGQSTKYSYDAYNFNTGTLSDKVNLYSTNATVGYQLDLWKKISNGKKAELYNYLATEKGAESTFMTVISNSIDLWYSIGEEEKAVSLIKNQISVIEKYLDLINLRASKGLATLLEVLQQKQILESVKNQLPMEELKLKVLKNQLAVLLGENPATFKFENKIIIPSIGNLPNTGIPAYLLQNRPDVKAAEYNLIASDSKLAVAIADRFPSINLGINFGSQVNSPSNLFDKWFLAFSGDILGPIFDGGRRKNEVMRNRAVVYEKFKTWQLSILNAIKEVEDSVITEKKYKETLLNTSSQVKLGKITLDQSLSRYLNGISDYLNVLNAQKTFYQLEREELRIKKQLISNRLKLYLALGGDFSEQVKKNQNINIKLEERK